MSLTPEFQPQGIAPSAFVAETAVVRGEVTIGPQSSVWFGSVIRGDTDRIQIGSGTNVQDLCVIHADAGVPCAIGDRVTLGHAAIVHGATVEDEVMIGIRATVLNGAKIGSGSIIAAGAVVTEGTEIPPGSLVMGIPGKVKCRVSDEQRERIRSAAAHYVEAARAYQKIQSRGDGDTETE